MHAGLLSTVVRLCERRYHVFPVLLPVSFCLHFSTNEIKIVLVVVFVSYLGGRGHVTKWLGTGCILQGMVVVIFM